MIIKINMQSEVPIYLQLRNEIVKGIGRGEFEPGESLPTIWRTVEIGRASCRERVSGRV